MSQPLLTAVAPRWEATLVTHLGRSDHVHVVRRCADVPELLGAAAAGLGRVALVSSDLRGLDRAAVDALLADGLRVVGVHPPGDENAQRALTRWGCVGVLPADADPDTVEAALAEAVAVAPGRPRAHGRDRDAVDLDGAAPDGTGWRALGDVTPDGGDDLNDVDVEHLDLGALGLDGHGPHQLPGATAAGADARGETDPHGRIVVVWGPPGSTGRTTVAVNLAAELADPLRPTLLVDADTWAASVAQHLGVLDEAPGLVAAARAADRGDLDRDQLARLAPEVLPGLRVLTGLPRADRWTELREVALADVLESCRGLAGWTVVDVAPPVEQDEDLAFDTAAPRRNGATLTALEAADVVLVVGSGDPVGLQRLVRSLDALAEVAAVERRVLVTRVRPGPVGPDPGRRVREALSRFAGVEDVLLVPEDRDVVDEAMLQGRVLREVRPRSAARLALLELAAELDPAVAVRRQHPRLRGGPDPARRPWGSLRR